MVQNEYGDGRSFCVAQAFTLYSTGESEPKICPVLEKAKKSEIHRTLMSSDLLQAQDFERTSIIIF